MNHFNSSNLESPFFTNELREECGLFGVYSSSNIDTFSLMEFGMFALQHRGQEACGLTVLKDGKLNTYKKDGLVLDAFKSIENIETFQGNAAIGHTRYTTAGDRSTYNFQPLYAKKDETPILSLAHNGNLTNADQQREILKKEGVEFLATSDTEVMLRMIEKNLHLGVTESIKEAAKHLRGAYSILLLTKDKFYAFRDPFGIRPLCYGIKDDAYVFSSETCALDAVGAKYVRDLAPGEMVMIDQDGIRSTTISEKTSSNLCSFEYIYFARPDSIMEEKDIYDVRVEGGKNLYKQSPVDADVVIGVPDSGIPAAIGYSEESGIPFQPILVKNRYMSRSFIVPDQKMRERVVNLKLNPIFSKIKGKRVVIIDDSIVRGTTSKRLVKILRDVGAKEIHFRSASPPIIAPCNLGIDTPTKKELISAQMNTEELRDFLQVDSLDFLTIENLTNILGSPNHCFGCFTSKYPTN